MDSVLIGTGWVIWWWFSSWVWFGFKGIWGSHGLREIWVVTPVAAAEIGSCGGGGLAKWRWLAGKGKTDDWSRWKLGSSAMAAELAMVEVAAARCMRPELAESLALSSAKASQNAL